MVSYICCIELEKEVLIIGNRTVELVAREKQHWHKETEVSNPLIALLVTYCMYYLEKYYVL